MSHKTEIPRPGHNSYFSDKKVTNRLLYKQYPYKTKPKGQFSSLVKHDEITDHKFTITTTEFSNILKVYFKHLLWYLMEGYAYKLPFQLGRFRIVKMKPATESKYIDWEKTNKYFGDHNKNAEFKDKIRIRFKRTHWCGYQPMIDWDKGRFSFREIWKFRIPKTLWNQMINNYNENPSLIYKLDDK
jgi:hypothetical protein